MIKYLKPIVYCMICTDSISKSDPLTNAVPHKICFRRKTHYNQLKNHKFPQVEPVRFVSQDYLNPTRTRTTRSPPFALFPWQPLGKVVAAKLTSMVAPYPTPRLTVGCDFPIFWFSRCDDLFMKFCFASSRFCYFSSCRSVGSVWTATYFMHCSFFSFSLVYFFFCISIKLFPEQTRNTEVSEAQW